MVYLALPIKTWIYPWQTVSHNQRVSPLKAVPPTILNQLVHRGRAVNMRTGPANKSRRQKASDTRPGKRLHNYGKIHPFYS
jgi:hypothetical protein